MKFQEYFRCYVIDQQHVHIMRYDPGAPHHLRYVPGNPPAAPDLHQRMEADALTLCRALGSDLNTVEFAVEDGIPYAIDFMNPAPDAGLESVGHENFPNGWWKHVADMAIYRAIEEPWLGSPLLPNFAGRSSWRFSRGQNEERTYGETRPSLTIGIEEEYQTVDPETRDLKSHITAEIIEKSKAHASRRAREARRCISRSSRPAPTSATTFKEAKAEIRDIRRSKWSPLARASNGLRLVAGGTAPVRPLGANQGNLSRRALPHGNCR